MGRPLGLYNLNADFRATEEDKAADSGRDTESIRWLEGMQRARELQDACPDTQVITVCDREGDTWEMLREPRCSRSEPPYGNPANESCDDVFGLKASGAAAASVRE